MAFVHFWTLFARLYSLFVPDFHLERWILISPQMGMEVGLDHQLADWAQEDGNRMDKAEEPWPQGLVSRVTWDLGPADSAWRELQEVCILFPVVAEVKSCFLFVLKLSHLDCFYYSNQCMYLDMYMVWYPKASSHLQFHFTVNLNCSCGIRETLLGRDHG